MIKQAIATLLETRDLLQWEAEGAMEDIVVGEATDTQIGAFLTALRMKGETVDELAAFVRVLRRHAVACRPHLAGRLVDTCGTGGDGMATFNISTTAALVAAGAGIPIVKHGNRGVSSRCGSADLLEALGVRIDLTPAEMCRVLDRCHFAFFFAPLYHPAMKRLVAPRRELGVRTVFNVLGPLLNPAGASAQLVGVYHPALGKRIAEVLKALGIERAMVVHGRGIDEIAVHGTTMVTELDDGKIKSYRLHPHDFGMTVSPPSTLKGGDAEENAMIVRSVLGGERGPKRDIVLLNAAAAIYLGGRCGDMKEGIDLAEESIDRGDAERVLDGLVRETGCCDVS
ncbi:MAG: anthranilate phosphoribosyltransferase [Methanomicrobiales archaeon]|nr:anthranilate phosphoribosyltransferase [Methanomicrobiales archaeon]